MAQKKWCGRKCIAMGTAAITVVAVVTGIIVWKEQSDEGIAKYLDLEPRQLQPAPTSKDVNVMAQPGVSEKNDGGNPESTRSGPRHIDVAMSGDTAMSPPALLTSIARTKDTARWPGESAMGATRVSAGTADHVTIDTDTGGWPLARNRAQLALTLPRNAVRAEEWVHWFEQGESTNDTPDPLTVNIETMASPWNAETVLARIAVEGRRDDPTPADKLCLTWLIDRSGSMDAAERFGLITGAMQAYAQGAGANVITAIVAYAGAVEIITEPSADNAGTLAAIDTLRNAGTGGGTAGSDGVAHALSLMKSTCTDHRRVLMLATDGDFNIGRSTVSGAKDLAERARKADIELHVMLVGQSNVRDDIGQALAQNGNGRAYYVDRLEEAMRVLNTQMPRPPVARDVKVRFEPNPAQVAEYRRIGLETRTTTEAEFADPATDGGELAAAASASVWYELVARESTFRYLPEQTYAGETPQVGDATELATVELRYRADGEAHQRTMQVHAREAGAHTRWLAAVLLSAEKARGTTEVRTITWEKIGASARAAHDGLDGGRGSAEREEFLGLIDSGVLRAAVERE